MKTLSNTFLLLCFFIITIAANKPAKTSKEAKISKVSETFEISSDSQTSKIAATTKTSKVSKTFEVTPTLEALPDPPNHLKLKTELAYKQFLLAEPKNAYDDYGKHIAISEDGNTVVVGAPGTLGGNTTAGAVYVYTWTGTDWSNKIKLTDSQGELGECFGFSVAINGNTIVVGAPFYNNPADNSSKGKIAVFENISGVWTQTTNIICPDEITTAGASFGYSVDIKGSTIVVGAPNDTYTVNNGAWSTGSITVLQKNLINGWSQATSKVLRPEIYDSSDFEGLNISGVGTSVAISTTGNTIVAGAPDEINYSRRLKCL